MGTKGRSILEVDVNTVLNELKRAYLDELMAFYSYWITAIVAEGFHGEELTEHFKQEAMGGRGQAERRATRSRGRGGVPGVHPKCGERGATPPSPPPRADGPGAGGRVEAQIRGGAGAIEAYNRLAKLTFGKDPVTYHLATELLADEVRHEEFLENLLGRK